MSRRLKDEADAEPSKLGAFLCDVSSRSISTILEGPRALNGNPHGARCEVAYGLPEIHRTHTFALAFHSRVWVAYYDRQAGGHDWVWRDPTTGVPTIHLNRVSALEAMFEEFHDGKAELPSNARRLGGRVRDGFGEYYREMTALTRVLEENAQENLVARYVRGGKDDHYAHAEAYCLLASEDGHTSRSHGQSGHPARTPGSGR